MLLAVAVLVVVIGVVSRRSQAARLGEQASAAVTRTVVVISPAAAGESAALELPARIEAWSRAPIYARVSGYLKGWKADIGTPVKAGQLLAEIETPELDQQLLQAQAELATARANAELARRTPPSAGRTCWPAAWWRSRPSTRRPATWPPSRRRCARRRPMSNATWR